MTTWIQGGTLTERARRAATIDGLIIALLMEGTCFGDYGAVTIFSLVGLGLNALSLTMFGLSAGGLLCGVQLRGAKHPVRALIALGVRTALPFALLIGNFLFVARALCGDGPVREGDDIGYAYGASIALSASALLTPLTFPFLWRLSVRWHLLPSWRRQ